MFIGHLSVVVQINSTQSRYDELQRETIKSYISRVHLSDYLNFNSKVYYRNASIKRPPSFKRPPRIDAHLKFAKI